MTIEEKRRKNLPPTKNQRPKDKKRKRDNSYEFKKFISPLIIKKNTNLIKIQLNYN